MSRRTVLSRPRTRLYDASYNMGESLYRPALDRLDRKYSGRPLTPPRQMSAVPQDIHERHERVFADEDINTARRRAHSLIAGETAFDSRGARLESRSLDFGDDIDEETVSRIKSIRASKKVALLDDVGLDSAVNNINSRRFIDRSEKILDSVGIGIVDANVPRSYDEDMTVKRRSLRITSTENGDVASKDMTRWTAIKKDNAHEESAASSRALQTKARLNDLQDEMDALAERQAAREKRVARLRALIAETSSDNIETEPTPTHRSIRFRERVEEKN